MTAVSRRDFMKGAAAATAAGSWMLQHAVGEETAARSTIYVVHGTDPAGMLQAGIERMGGWGAFIKQGKKVTLKPNAAWASLPEQGGNTDPVLVGACVSSCLKAGAGSVVVPEKPCSDAKQSFSMSGIWDAVKKAKGTMYAPKDGEHFRKTELPGAQTLKEADVVGDVLDADCLINMPVAKSHSGATLTLSMKNWMGSVQDRGAWHRMGLHQCIADFSTLVKPSLIVIDATRIMLTKGPRGPGELAHPNQIILGTDPVAVDAYAATLFEKEPFSIPHIQIAHDMKIGCGNLKQVEVVEIRA